jgi:hypothetical protein
MRNIIDSLKTHVFYVFAIIKDTTFVSLLHQAP